MRSITIGAAVLSVALITASSASAQNTKDWRNIDIGGGQIATCAADLAGNALCVTMENGEVAAMFTPKVDRLATDFTPFFKVDDWKGHDQNELEELMKKLGKPFGLTVRTPNQSMWRAMTPTNKGEAIDRSNPNGIWAQLKTGQRLAVIYKTAAGKKKAARFGLATIGSPLDAMFHSQPNAARRQ